MRKQCWSAAPSDSQNGHLWTALRRLWTICGAYHARGRIYLDPAHCYGEHTRLTLRSCALADRRRARADRRAPKDTERNHWMTASEAVAYGLVGRVVRNAGELSRGAG
jgi:hypothetical protein